MSLWQPSPRAYRYSLFRSIKSDALMIGPHSLVVRFKVWLDDQLIGTWALHRREKPPMRSFLKAGVPHHIPDPVFVEGSHYLLELLGGAGVVHQTGVIGWICSLGKEIVHGGVWVYEDLLAGSDSFL